MSEEGEVTALQTFRSVLELHSGSELKRRLEAAENAEESRAADIEEFDSLLDQLVDTVSEGFMPIALEAAKEGKRTAELFSFDGAQKFGDTEHSILFLCKGPRKKGQDFFLKLGILPFLPRLYQSVRPFEVDLQYFPEANENTVNISW